LQTLFVDVSTTQALIADPRVAAVTLTGSERAGQAVARATGQALKKTVLELGGSDPFIVLESADLDRAVESAVRARVVNSGQSCIAAKRFIVVEPVADAFTTRFVAAMAALRVGDPFDPDTELGPLATAAIRDTLVDQVQRACAHGARALTGGAPIPGPGYYYAPTVLTSITRDSPIFHEELFGPVALLFQAPDATAALRLANDTPFGLSSSVWTRNPQEQEQFVSELESGAVFINGMSVSDPRLPFGGVKRSGYGRELGVYGIREWVNVKSIVVTTP
jgi:succinate-semialdehyde dehydrogenase/glutarate-semialdehyde dehydrogenase